MDYQAAFNVVLGFAAFVGGALSKIMWDTLSSLRADMTRLSDSVNQNQKESSDTYMRRDDFSAAIARIEAAMNRGFDQLAAQIAAKADKQ
jgi:hypothetical protein